MLPGISILFLVGSGVPPKLRSIRLRRVVRRFAPRDLGIWWVLLAVGCGAPSQLEDSGDSDASAPSDTEDTDVPIDPDTADPDQPALPEDGHVAVVWTQSPGAAPSAFVLAQLYDELTPGAPSVQFAKPGDLDTCALTLYTLDDLNQGTLPTYQHRSAGPLTLTGPSGAVTVPYASGEYYRELSPASVPLGGSYAVSSPGADFPALSGDLDVPSGRTLTQPGSGFRAAGPLQVRWTGGDPGELTLRLEAGDLDGARGLVWCRVDNDGEHTVPAALIDPLPSGRVSLHLEQVHARRVAAGDRWVRFYGSVVDVVAGDVP